MLSNAAGRVGSATGGLPYGDQEWKPSLKLEVVVSIRPILLRLLYRSTQRGYSTPVWKLIFLRASACLYVSVVSFMLNSPHGNHFLLN